MDANALPHAAVLPAAPAAVRVVGREVLRKATGPAHERLEQTPLMRALTGGSLTGPQYADYLRRQYCLHAAFESALEAWAPLAWLDVRLVKARWLAADLAALGVDARRLALPSMPIDSRAEAMGVAYVLEGATLGASRLRRTLPPAEAPFAGAHRFLDGYGEATGRLWAEFIAGLEQLAPAGLRRAVAGAITTFAAFHSQFRTDHHDPAS